MLTDYPHVFSPIKIGPIEVSNRFFMPPHGIPLVVPGPHGTTVPSDDFACYYAERAAGGVALMGHSLSVLPLPGGLACPAYAEAIPSFAKVADLTHSHGSRIFGQLHYSSLATGPLEPLSPRAPVLGASSYQRYERYDTYHEMSRGEIRQLVQMYHRCAHHLRLAGYDGVQVHAAHGVLIEQFLSPFFNHRDDEYGCDPSGRLLVEALSAVREGGGQDMAIGVRLVCDERLPGGLTNKDIIEILVELADRELLDFADMDIAVEPQQPELMTTPSLVAPLHLVDDVAAVRKAVSPRIVVITSLGSVTNVAVAERMIADGAVDMVGAARGLIAEPELIIL